jgi:hypothetical protein
MIHFRQTFTKKAPYVRSSGERAQGSARTCVRQSRVEHNVGRSKRRESEPFSDIDNAGRCGAMRQRCDRKAGGHRGDDSLDAAGVDRIEIFTGGGTVAVAGVRELVIRDVKSQ